MKVFLVAVLRWLASLPWADFARVVVAVRNAQTAHPKTPQMTDAEKAEVNVKRAAQVREWIGRILPQLTGWRLNVVLELAVAYFNRTAK